MIPNLDGYEAKLRRVDENIADLRRIVKAVKDNEPFQIGNKFDPEGRKLDSPFLPVQRNIFFAKNVKPMPHELGIRVGEIMYGLRSALDNLAFRVWHLNGRTDVPPKIEFPIYMSQVKLDDARIRIKRWERIDPAHFATMCSFQPYVTGGANYAKEPLWILHELCNIDKHRAIPVSFWTFIGADIAVSAITRDPLRARVEIEVLGSEVEEGAHLYATTMFGRAPGTESNMKGKVKSLLCFGTSCGDAKSMPVFDVVMDARNYINDNVFAAFRPLFL